MPPQQSEAFPNRGRGSDAKKPKRMMNIIAAKEIRESIYFRKKKQSAVVSITAERSKERKTEMMLLSFANKKVIGTPSENCFSRVLGSEGRYCGD